MREMKKHYETTKINDLKVHLKPCTMKISIVPY